MPDDELENALKILGYTGEPGTDFSSSESKPVVQEIEDESLVRYLLQAITLRSLKRVDEGYELLKTKVLPKVYQDAPRERGRKRRRRRSREREREKSSGSKINDIGDL